MRKEKIWNKKQDSHNSKILHKLIDKRDCSEFHEIFKN